MSQQVVACPGCLYSGQPHLDTCSVPRFIPLKLFIVMEGCRYEGCGIVSIRITEEGAVKADKGEENDA